VTYLNSYEPDQLAAYACAVLAMEFAQACARQRLPPADHRAVHRRPSGPGVPVSDRGVPGGTTGIREVDAWLALWNPGTIRQAPAVWSPDQRAPRVVNP
jgi:hypothetical protein